MKAQILGLFQNYMFTAALMISTILKITDSTANSATNSTALITTMLIETNTIETALTKSFDLPQTTTSIADTSTIIITTSSVKTSPTSLLPLNFSISRKHWTKNEDVPVKHRNIQSKIYKSKHHHEHHWGPFFEEPLNTTTGALQLITYVDTEAVLNCRVGMLRDKTVMWVRRTSEKVSLLTVGNVTYSGDPRIKVKFQYPNNWRLLINPVQKDDESLYMCQVSTHPPRVFATNLTVLERPIRFVDEKGREVNDRFYKAGSTIDLTCQILKHFLKSQEVNLRKKVNQTALLPNNQNNNNSINNNHINKININNNQTNLSTNKTENIATEKQLNQYIFWRKDGTSLPHNIINNTSTDTGSTAFDWHNSRITIPKATFSDGGLYSCSIANIYEVTVHVQVLTGELPAAVQHNSKLRNELYFNSFIILFFPSLFSFVHISHLT